MVTLHGIRGSSANQLTVIVPNSGKIIQYNIFAAGYFRENIGMVRSNILYFVTITLPNLGLFTEAIN